MVFVYVFGSTSIIIGQKKSKDLEEKANYENTINQQHMKLIRTSFKLVINIYIVKPNKLPAWNVYEVVWCAAKLGLLYT